MPNRHVDLSAIILTPLTIGDGQEKIPGEGDSFTGKRIIVDSDGVPFICFRADTEPNVITLANADYRIVGAAQETSEPSFL